MEKYIPEGYKQTGIGEIPEDWVYKKISELTNIFGRIGFRGYTKRDIVEVGKGAISISPSNILDTRINYEKCTFISWYKYEESPEIQIVNNDVILVKTGSTFGKAALIHNLPNKATINPQLVVFKDIRIPNIYLSYLINSKIVQNQIQKNVVGGAIPTLSQAMVKNFVVPIPHSRREQESIARALSDVDNLITSLEQLIEKKKAIKQGTMQELLTGRRRLKGFGEGKGFKQTELGMIPEDWKVSKLANISTLHGRIGWQGLKQSEFTDNPHDPFLITGMNFKDSRIVWEDVYHFSIERYREAPHIQLHTNDVLLTKDGTIGKTLYIESIPYPGIASLNSHLLVFRPIGDSYTPKYLFYLFNSKYFYDHVEQQKSGTTFFGLSQEAASKFILPLPSNEEQSAIANVLTDMDSEIVILETKAEKYMQIKQGMMQNLLTGRVRLV